MYSNLKRGLRVSYKKHIRQLRSWLIGYRKPALARNQITPRGIHHIVMPTDKMSFQQWQNGDYAKYLGSFINNKKKQMNYARPISRS